MSSREIDVNELQDELLRWADGDRLALHGRINDGDASFPIGEAKDAHGTVLRLHPLDEPEWSHAQDQSKKKKNGPAREWLQWWAKIAVRSGYRLPEIDPAAFAALVRLRAEDRCRIELIFDTNGLVGGIGHWLVRVFGDRADLVRTVVTDLEIQNLGDNLEMAAGNLNHWGQRATYLAASRFMERVPHPHPIWRRLDTGEETALFVAQSSAAGSKGAGSKNAGRDTLLLRACRRAILDQVPDLHRFFVTEDKNVARAALHELPRGSIISAYVNPLPHEDVHLTPYPWLPSPGRLGRIYPSNLAAFVWEALCLCAVVEVHREDGAVWQVRAYEPGANQYPSTWAAPRVYVEERGGTRAVAAPEPSWPLRSVNAELLEPGPAGRPAVPAKTILAAFAEIVASIRESRQWAVQRIDGSARTKRNLMALLEMGRFIDDDAQLLPAAAELPALFAQNDLDGVSRLCTAVAPYHELISRLRVFSGLHQDEIPGLLGSADQLASLARLLGQAVTSQDLLVFGGEYIDHERFCAWLLSTVEKLSSASPLGEATVAAIARLALSELELSPVRFGRALGAALALPELSSLETATGGRVERILVEEIAVLGPDGVRYEEVSADGLCGIRSLKKRSA